MKATFRTARRWGAGLLSALLCVLLIGSTAVSAATNLTNGAGDMVSTNVRDSEGNAQAAISTTIETPSDTMIASDLTFTFTFTQMTQEDVDAAFAEAYGEDGTDTYQKLIVSDVTAEIADVTISFSAGTDGEELAEQQVVIDMTSEGVDEVDGYQNLIFTEAGYYLYKVTEKADTNELLDSESMDYSKALYYMIVEVEHRLADDGKQMSSLQISDIFVYRAAYDNGTTASAAWVTGQDTSNKVDATPESGYEFLFTNRYNLVTEGGEFTESTRDGGENGTLVVTKEVTGSLGSYEQYFQFKTLFSNLTDVLTEDNANFVFEAYIIDADGSTIVDRTTLLSEEGNHVAFRYGGADAEVISAESYIDSSGKITIQSDGITLLYSLKHGQSLYVKTALVGAVYEADENAGYASYNTTYRYLITSVLGEEETTLSDGRTASGVYRESEIIQTGKNLLTVQNAYTSDITVTGLFVNNLPYIALIALAAAVIFVLFIGTRIRKQKD